MPAIDISMHATSLAPTVAASTAAPAPKAGHHGFSFSDFLDIINPLQHLPVIGTLYRKLTGDEIGTPEKIAGDTLFGGIPGLVSSLADTAFEKLTGKNFGDTALALIQGDGFGKEDVAVATITAPVASSAMALASAGDAPVAVEPAQLGNLPTAESITAALNRAQIDLAKAARATIAYGRAVALAQPGAPDKMALAN